MPTTLIDIVHELMTANDSHFFPFSGKWTWFSKPSGNRKKYYPFFLKSLKFILKKVDVRWHGALWIRALLTDPSGSLSFLNWALYRASEPSRPKKMKKDLGNRLCGILHKWLHAEEDDKLIDVPFWGLCPSLCTTICSSYMLLYKI